MATFPGSLTEGMKYATQKHVKDFSLCFKSADHTASNVATFIVPRSSQGVLLVALQCWNCAAHVLPVLLYVLIMDTRLDLFTGIRVNTLHCQSTDCLGIVPVGFEMKRLETQY